MAKTVPGEQAMAVPPAAGPSIVSVIERRFDNAVEQEIYLSTSAVTPGQNLLKVQFFGTASPFRYSSNNLGGSAISQSGISSEISKALRGVPMVRSQFYVQNSYGPFGYAFGRRAGDLCMYGWQQIRSPALTRSPMANAGTVQVRVRLCEAGATEQKLLAFMYNFTINGTVDSMGWNPWGESAPLSPGFGASGSPIYPRPASTEMIVPVAPQMAPVRRLPSTTPVRTMRTTMAAPAAAAVETVPSYPVARVPTVAAASGQSVYPASPAAGRSVMLPADPSSAPSAPSRVRVPSPSCMTQSGVSNATCR